MINKILVLVIDYDYSWNRSVIAWFPHYYFKLSFGLQDQCAKILSQYLDKYSVEINENTITGNNVDQLRLSINNWLHENPKALQRLMCYVPYRLLTPFCEHEVQGISDGAKHRTIGEYAEEYFEQPGVIPGINLSIIHIMMENEKQIWGDPAYPVVD
ncbi:MAG: hypothetical protein GXP22_09995 [Gammaproteobacteria bacterium]|nr:hypothetical protein [Gammaproteobacteria bacterium]